MRNVVAINITDIRKLSGRWFSLIRASLFLIVQYRARTHVRHAFITAMRVPDRAYRLESNFAASNAKNETLEKDSN